MRVLITGDISAQGAVAKALDAVHNKRRIAIVLTLSSMTMAAIAAEAWAGSNGVLCADVHESGERVAIFDIADSIIALPGTSDELLRMAGDRGIKVWQPYKPQTDC